MPVFEGMDNGLNIRILYEFVETDGIINVPAVGKFLFQKFVIVNAMKFRRTFRAYELLSVEKEFLAANTDFGESEASQVI